MGRKACHQPVGGCSRGLLGERIDHLNEIKKVKRTRDTTFKESFIK